MQVKIDHLPPLPILSDELGRLVPPPVFTHFYNIKPGLEIDLKKCKLKVFIIGDQEVQMTVSDNREVTDDQRNVDPTQPESMFALKMGEPYDLHSTASGLRETWRLILRP